MSAHFKQDPSGGGWSGGSGGFRSGDFGSMRQSGSFKGSFKQGGSTGEKNTGVTKSLQERSATLRRARSMRAGAGTGGDKQKLLDEDLDAALDKELGLDKSGVAGQSGVFGPGGAAEKRARGRVLPLQFVEKNIRDRIASDGFYSDFFVYVPFLISFMIFFLSGRDITTNHMAAAASMELYRGQEFPSNDVNVAKLNAQGSTTDPNVHMDRVFAQIENAEHWHEWMQSVLIPET